MMKIYLKYIFDLESMDNKSTFVPESVNLDTGRR